MVGIIVANVKIPWNVKFLWGYYFLTKMINLFFKDAKRTRRTSYKPRPELYDVK